MNITCKFEQIILKINLLIAFLLKKFKTVGFSLRTLYVQLEEMFTTPIILVGKGYSTCVVRT